jgi:hypothetical protein
LITIGVEGLVDGIDKSSSKPNPNKKFNTIGKSSAISGDSSTFNGNWLIYIEKVKACLEQAIEEKLKKMEIL